jgi:hypothetical protein
MSVVPHGSVDVVVAAHVSESAERDSGRLCDKSIELVLCQHSVVSTDGTVVLGLLCGSFAVSCTKTLQHKYTRVKHPNIYRAGIVL